MKYLYGSFLLIQLLACTGKNETGNYTPKDIDSLLAQFPDSLPIIIRHGEEKLKQFDFDKALQDGAKAFRLDSNNQDARLLYANVLNNRPNRSSKEVFIAQRHYQTLVKKNPKNTKALIGLASTYSQQMDFDKSFEYINQALRIDQKNRDAYTLKGTNYLILGKIDRAKSSYETAVQQDPKFFEAYLMLGTLYQQEENVVCIEYFTTAAKLQPKNPDVLFALAYAKQLFGDYQSALPIYRKMFRVDTTAVMALNQIGVIKQYNYNDIDSAMYYYNSAITSEPRLVEAWHNLGTCWESKGDITRALQSYAKALKYNPDYLPSKERAEKLR